MIQELFGGASGERKISNINEGGAILLPSPNTSLLSPSSTPQSITATSTTAATATAATSNSSENQNLRCPRCDSPNTKFCYYNNYNLTQPRHFCKTCRRYWTKGGALRNVPIGGGCRKNKNAAVSNSVAKAATATKMKAVVASELGRSSGILGQPLFDHHDHLPPTPILWGSPQNTHLLSLLRAGQNPNPNPSPMPITNAAVKEERNLLRSQSQSHMVTNSEPLLANGVVLNNNIPRTLGYDAVAVGHVTSSQGLCGSFWRNNNQEIQIQQQNSGFVNLGEHQSSGIQEFYHRLRSSSVNYNCSDNISPTTFLGNMASSSSSSLSNMLESSSVSGTEQFGCWNPTLNWSDLPTTNGAYP